MYLDSSEIQIQKNGKQNDLFPYRTFYALAYVVTLIVMDCHQARLQSPTLPYDISFEVFYSW